MTFTLTDLDLIEISGVDSPANQHAAVVLFKRSGYNPVVKPFLPGFHKEGEVTVTVEELTKKVEALSAQVTDLTKKATDADTAKAAAETALAALTKSASEAGMDVQDGKIVKRADPEYVEIDGERVEKSLVPAPVLKMLEANAAKIAKMEADAADVALAKRGDTELPHLAGTAIAKGRLLAAVEAAKDEALLKSLKAADAVMKAAATEIGNGKPEDDASPAFKLEQLAKAHATAANVPYEVAYSEVTKAGNAGAPLLAAIRSGAN